MCSPDGPMFSHWFALTLDRKNAPWAYRAGEPFRSIASLELFASLLCVKLFFTDQLDPDADYTLVLTGETDNRGNSFAVNRLLTSKFPLCAFLMELAATLWKAGVDCELAWVPRLQNTEADELSNQIFRNFDERLRVPVELDKLHLIVLDQLLDEGEKLFGLVSQSPQQSEAKPKPQEAETKTVGIIPSFKRQQPNKGAKRKRRASTRLRVTHPW